ncbi:Uncharacterized protein dnm_062300 [Desulfonema magnum]|uniref:Uncharacterized protein n=1 Tax=Desulfonema magnum TaxID=45655 RepID=A0A975BQU3_9BACT|nr:Uncharacterized protein dnm_062300 [Desulfonema magnum]
MRNVTHSVTHKIFVTPKKMRFYDYNMLKTYLFIWYKPRRKESAEV